VSNFIYSVLVELVGGTKREGIISSSRCCWCCYCWDDDLVCPKHLPTHQKCDAWYWHIAHERTWYNFPFHWALAPVPSVPKWVDGCRARAGPRGASRPIAISACCWHREPPTHSNRASCATRDIPPRYQNKPGRRFGYRVRRLVVHFLVNTLLTVSDALVQVDIWNPWIRNLPSDPWSRIKFPACATSIPMNCCGKCVHKSNDSLHVLARRPIHPVFRQCEAMDIYIDIRRHMYICIHRYRSKPNKSNKYRFQPKEKESNEQHVTRTTHTRTHIQTQTHHTGCNKEALW